MAGRPSTLQGRFGCDASALTLPNGRHRCSGACLKYPPIHKDFHDHYPRGSEASKSAERNDENGAVAEPRGLRHGRPRPAMSFRARGLVADPRRIHRLPCGRWLCLVRESTHRIGALRHIDSKMPAWAMSLLPGHHTSTSWNSRCDKQRQSFFIARRRAQRAGLCNNLAYLMSN